MKTANIIEKPWGHEEIWASSSRYVGKTLFIKEHQRISRQYHRVKEETIMVLKGVLIVEAGPHDAKGDVETFRLGQGMTFHIPPGTVHRFTAERGGVRLVEVSTPETHDIVRIEDDYGRPTEGLPPTSQRSRK